MTLERVRLLQRVPKRLLFAALRGHDILELELERELVEAESEDGISKTHAWSGYSTIRIRTWVRR